MALRHPLFVSGASAGVTSPQDARLALAALLPGPGLLNGYAVSGSTSGPNMKYLVAAGVAATARGVVANDGLYLVANDGTVTVDSGAPAPASGTRWDLVWVRCLNAFDGGFGDANSDPVFGVTVGTAGSAPTKPYSSVPAGALVLAESNVGTNIASASLATISNVAAHTQVATLDTGWISITNIASGWTPDSNPPAARQIGNRVYVRGGITDANFVTGTYQQVCNLPAGVGLPTQTAIFAIPGTTATTRCARVLTNGQIQFIANVASATTYSMDVISYLTD